MAMNKDACVLRCMSKITDMQGTTHIKLVRTNYSGAYLGAHVDLVLNADQPDADYFIPQREYKLSLEMVPIHHVVTVDPLDITGEMSDIG